MTKSNDYQLCSRTAGVKKRGYRETASLADKTRELNARESKESVDATRRFKTPEAPRGPARARAAQPVRLRALRTGESGADAITGNKLRACCGGWRRPRSAGKPLQRCNDGAGW